ncbi:MAG: DUF2339 domain-containing protein [Bryobacterales bacterium]|nr:DUF2339 domain-containing protein [Bryobacterales bacterium]
MEWIFLVALAVIVYLRARSDSESRRRLEETVRELTARVYHLEHPGGAVFTSPPPPPAPLSVADPEPASEPPPVPIPTPDIPLPPPPPTQTLGDRIRHYVGDDEWEALVGGSLLNKLGALILVVGIILFLGYSFTRMGPAGRVAVSVGTGAALLAAGIFIERKQRYRVFAWGLLGAGWATLYATSYAMYALDAARVIENETVGVCLQLAVAAAMLGHSLKYRQQTVTGIAAASAFAALALSPSKPFAATGLLPLSTILLALAHRLRWHAVGLFSLVASYGILIARGDQGSALYATQAFLFVLWLIFEAFDLLQLSDPQPPPAYAGALFPLNALGFLGLSAMKWESAAPDHLYLFLAAAAALYLLDSILRAYLRKDAYRASIVLASALAALAIVRHAGGAWAAAMLAIEAELLFLAALKWRLRFLEWLAGAVFACALIRLVVTATSVATITLAGFELHDWTPAATLIAILAYVNRFYRTAPVPYGYFGAAVVQLTLGAESSERWLGLVWFIWAAIQMEFGLWRKAADLLRQSYFAWAFGCLAFAFTHLSKFTKDPPTVAWVSLAGAAVLAFHGCWRLWRANRALLASTAAALSATVFALHLGDRVLPDNRVALAWMAVALLWVECGYRWAHPALRWLGHAVAALVLGALAWAKWTTSTVLPVAAGYVWLWRRCLDTPWTRAYSWVATLLVVLLLHTELTPPQAVISWALLGLALFLAGLHITLPDLRWQSYALAAATTFRCLAWVQDDPLRAAACATAAAVLYAQEFLAPRQPARPAWERFARPAFSALATLLVSVLLYRESSGSLLTMAWGIQGLLLLVAGFPLRERVLRISGLLLLLVCILKLFFYDLRNLETLPRIFSFIVLGVILIGVSWAYTRFRERLQRIVWTPPAEELTPSSEERDPGPGQQSPQQ